MSNPNTEIPLAKEKTTWRRRVIALAGSVALGITGGVIVHNEVSADKPRQETATPVTPTPEAAGESVDPVATPEASKPTPSPETNEKTAEAYKHVGLEFVKAAAAKLPAGIIANSTESVPGTDAYQLQNTPASELTPLKGKEERTVITATLTYTKQNGRVTGGAIEIMGGKDTATSAPEDFFATIVELPKTSTLLTRDSDGPVLSQELTEALREADTTKVSEVRAFGREIPGQIAGEFDGKTPVFLDENEQPTDQVPSDEALSSTAEAVLAAVGK